MRGWRETPIFARSEWWKAQKHPVALPAPVCELLDIIEHFTATQVRERFPLAENAGGKFLADILANVRH